MKTSTSPPFLWGAATSSHQIEGHNRHNDWWAWESTGAIDGGVRSGAATDHWNRFREDLGLARDLGLTSYRFSIEWSRLEPSEGKWDSAAMDWYSELIDECGRLGLVPMATLHHFTLPGWLAEQNGFSHEGAPKRFAAYASRVARSLGSRVPLWCTVNEPLVLATGSYLGRFMPPAQYDPKAASQTCYNLLKSHVLAYDILKGEISKREGPFRERPLEVGFAHNMLHFVPERHYHPLEIVVARALSGLYNDAWLAAVNGEKQRFGLLGVLPLAPQLAQARRRRTFDFIGVNYYTKAYVQWRPRAKSKERAAELPLGISFARRRETASDLGWAIDPAGFRHMLAKLRRFNAPVYVTENGIADANDQFRQAYLLRHLREVAHAKANGLDIRGYYHWSLLDNFEWIKGFWPRFGLYSVDYETLARTARKSAYFYRELIDAHAPGAPPDPEILSEFDLFTQS